MSFEALSALFFFALVSSITPGPNNLMLMASGANFGIRRTLPHMLGVTLGFTVMLVLVGIGLIRVFSLFPLTYTLMKIASVAYLLYLSWKIATAAPQLDSQAAGKPFSFVQAALFQWVNPKAWAMAITATSVYTLTQSLPEVLVVALVFAAVNLPCILIWATMGTQMRRFLNNSRRLRVFNYCMAMLLLGSLYPVLFGSVRI